MFLLHVFIMTTLGQLLGELQEVERSLFRQYERTLQRISCAETNCIFNQTVRNNKNPKLYSQSIYTQRVQKLVVIGATSGFAICTDTPL